MTDQARKSSRNTRIKVGITLLAYFFGILGIFWMLARIQVISEIIYYDAIQASVILIAIAFGVSFIIACVIRAINNKYPVHPWKLSAWPDEDAPRLFKRIFEISFLISACLIAIVIVSPDSPINEIMLVFFGISVAILVATVFNLISMWYTQKEFDRIKDMLTNNENANGTKEKTNKLDDIAKILGVIKRRLDGSYGPGF